MADELGSYPTAFYTGGAITIFASAIPLLLLCIKTPDRNAPVEEVELNVEHSSD